jgi:hypothetical protein
MRKRLFYPCLVLVFGAMISSPPLSARQAARERIQLTLDTSEAEQALAIAMSHRDGGSITDTEWQKLFATQPYQRLKKREEQIGQAHHDGGLAFADDDFKKFVLSDDLLGRAADLRSTLDQWKEGRFASKRRAGAPVFA